MMIYDDGACYNSEMNSLYKDEIRTQCLRWLGHLDRMNGSSIAKLMFEENLKCRQERGRPKLI